MADTSAEVNGRKQRLPVSQYSWNCCLLVESTATAMGAMGTIVSSSSESVSKSTPIRSNSSVLSWTASLVLSVTNEFLSPPRCNDPLLFL